MVSNRKKVLALRDALEVIVTVREHPHVERVTLNDRTNDTNVIFWCCRPKDYGYTTMTERFCIEAHVQYIGRRVEVVGPGGSKLHNTLAAAINHIRSILDA